jgi:O-antigen ligase
MVRVLVFCYLIALLVRPQDWFGPFIGLPTGFVITLAMFTGGLINFLSDRPRYEIPHNRLLPIYIVVIFASTLLNTDFGNAMDQAVTFTKRAVLFFSIVWLVNTRDRAYFAVWSFLLILLFLSFQAILQAQTGLSWGGQTVMPGYLEIRVRWHGDWDGPNSYALLFVLGVAMTMEFVFGPYGTLTRLFSFGLSSMYFVAIFYTNSRGAILALLGMTALYFKDRFSKPVAITLAAVAILGITAFGPSRMSEINTKESSAHERSWAWEQGLNMLRQNPVLGVGRGEFHRRVDSGLLAHNNYVQNFAELGLTGFLLFMSLLWFTWRGGYLMSRLPVVSAPPLPSLGRMITGAVAGYCLVTFFVVMELDILYFSLGLCTAMYCIARREVPELPVLRLTRWDVSMVCAGAGVIIVAIWLISVKSIV